MSILRRRIRAALRALGLPTRDTVHEVAARVRLRRYRPGPTPRRARPVVVTITTTAARLPHTEPGLASLVTQDLRPDAVVLWLDEDLAGVRLPGFFRRLTAAGLEVRHAPDVGPHTKLVHALRAFPDALLVTGDDDILYPADWLSALVASHDRAPGQIHCHRAHLMRLDDRGRLLPYLEWDLEAPGESGPSHRLFPTGVGGVLYPPGALADEVHDVAAFSRLCPTADDVWFKAMALLRGTPARKVAATSPAFRHVRAMAPHALYAENVTRNDEQIRATFEAYDLVRRL